MRIPFIDLNPTKLARKLKQNNKNGVVTDKRINQNQMDRLESNKMFGNVDLLKWR